MQFTKSLFAVLLAVGVSANNHKYCNCHVNGALDVGLSHDACTAWGGIYPNTEWVSNRASCHDYNPSATAGIDGARWESFCKTEYHGNQGVDAVRGNCFEK
ncbi:hypothetical protein F4803DRAFT_551863 [Xylaria telfairii]|nr:hypothetical protein F4803DRAFT_551863 [Xylaria telfairii]